MENIWCVSINCYHKLSTILENGFLNWGLRLSRSRDLHLHYNDFCKCWMRNSNFLWGFHWKHTINNCIVNANHIVHSKLTIKCYENKSIRNLCFGTWEIERTYIQVRIPIDSKFMHIFQRSRKWSKDGTSKNFSDFCVNHFLMGEYKKKTLEQKA